MRHRMATNVHKVSRLLVHPSTEKVCERMFNALAAGGTVKIPLQKTFWSSAYGLVVDRFGIPWEVSCADTG